MRTLNGKSEATVDPGSRDARPHGFEGCEFEATLLAIAGHDLRQPLQILQNVHDRFGNYFRTEAELRLLRIGQGAIHQLREQLDALVRALRVREGASQIELRPVAVGPILREICRENEWSALQKGIRLRLVATSTAVMSDEFLLGTAFRNLITNAIKYTEPGGQIL
jgi:two-component system, OmpR family, phosphate regulon sensor histidine kinase PhoR